MKEINAEIIISDEIITKINSEEELIGLGDGGLWDCD